MANKVRAIEKTVAGSTIVLYKSGTNRSLYFNFPVLSVSETFTVKFVS